MKESRIERIRAVLEAYGPMTAKQIAEETYIVMTDVCMLIRRARKDPGDLTPIRHAGKTREGVSRMSWLYELSDEPDVVTFPVRFEPSRAKKIKHPKLTRQEIADRKRITELAAESKPFRHWQDVAFFGSHA
jgi:hypothetical protein